MDITKTLEKLCGAGGVSGDEKRVHDTVLKLLKPYASDAKADPMGNITAVIGEDKKKPLILLDAHIDRIGMIVTHIDEDGFLKVSGIGIDRRTLLAQSVTVCGREKSFKGIISTLPPHVDSDRKKSPKLEDIAIDVGMTKGEAEENFYPRFCADRRQIFKAFGYKSMFSRHRRQSGSLRRFVCAGSAEKGTKPSLQNSRSVCGTGGGRLSWGGGFNLQSRPRLCHCGRRKLCRKQRRFLFRSGRAWQGYNDRRFGKFKQRYV